MIVVADTTPINYLILIDEVDLLAAVYGTVAIPEAVLHELMAPRAPAAVRRWIRNRPAWLGVERVDPQALGETAAFLDVGEREAIALARKLQAELLIIDDRAGRREALKSQIPVIGTLGILLAAANLGLVNLSQSIERLRKTSFHVSPKLLDSLLGHK